MLERLISADALLADLKAEARFADLRNEELTKMIYEKVIGMVEAAHVLGYLNLTEIVFYGGSRE